MKADFPSNGRSRSSGAQSPDPWMEKQRAVMVDAIRKTGVTQAVVEAVAAVPRHEFVPLEAQRDAYEDIALPIGGGQTISQPSLVAIMTAALRVAPTDKVLDIGTGSGYQAAILSRLAAEVISVERVPELAQAARSRLDLLGYRNVRVEVAGDTLGWPEAAPYNAIVVAAAAPSVPGVLFDQLAMGGRLVIPVGNRTDQVLVAVTKTPTGREVTEICPCRFVPLIGPDAWPEEQ